MLSVRCPWAIPGDMSREQMARNAGLDLREEVRPERTALRTAAELGRGGGGGEQGATVPTTFHTAPRPLLSQPVTSVPPNRAARPQRWDEQGPEGGGYSAQRLLSSCHGLRQTADLRSGAHEQRQGVRPGWGAGGRQG